MKKVLILIGVFAAFFLIVPFLLNLFIGFPSPKNIDVVGEGKDWVAFFGSYIGSSLAVIGSLLICQLTIKETRNQQSQDFFYSDIQNEIKLLSGLIERFTPAEILNFLDLTQPPTKEDDREKEVWRLQLLLSEYSRLMYLAKLNYDYSYSSELCKNFFLSYQKMLGNTILLISNLINLYKTEREKETWSSEMKSFKDKVMHIEQYEKPDVVNNAQKYIKELKTEFNNRQKKGVHIF